MHECRKQYASEILLQKNCSETEDQLILITIKLAKKKCMSLGHLSILTAKTITTFESE